MNDLYKFIESYRKSLRTLNLVCLNDVTEYDRRYELVELKMELENPSLPKCQFQFQFRSLEKFQFPIPIPFPPILTQFQFNSNSELN